MQRCRQCWEWARRAAGAPQSPALLNEGGAAEEEPEYRVRVESFELQRGRHAVYSLTVSREGASWPLRRRYRQIFSLHGQLLAGLGRSAMRDGLPKFPPRVTCRSVCYGARDERFLVARAAQLQAYFDALLRYVRYVDQCEALREFLCSVNVDSMNYDALLDLGQAIGRAPTSAPTIDAAAIAALPSRPPRARHGGEGSFAPSLCGCCVICQEGLEEDQDVRVLPCGHEFHYGCIAQWVPQSNTCCICQGMAVVPITASPSQLAGK